jgi:hypothetical protein
LAAYAYVKPGALATNGGTEQGLHHDLHGRDATEVCLLRNNSLNTLQLLMDMAVDDRRIARINEIGGSQQRC